VLGATLDGAAPSLVPWQRMHADFVTDVGFYILCKEKELLNRCACWVTTRSHLIVYFLLLCIFLVVLGYHRRVVYHLSYTSSPFCSGYFGDRVSFFAQTCLGCHLPILGFLL
jgi:hypothetical protein